MIPTGFRISACFTYGKVDLVLSANKSHSSTVNSDMEEEFYFEEGQAPEARSILK